MIQAADEETIKLARSIRRDLARLQNVVEEIAPPQLELLGRDLKSLYDDLDARREQLKLKLGLPEVGGEDEEEEVEEDPSEEEEKEEKEEKEEEEKDEAEEVEQNLSEADEEKADEDGDDGGLLRDFTKE